MKVAETLQYLEGGNVKQVIKLSQENSHYRLDLGSSAEIWDFIAKNLSQELLPLIANVAASPTGNEMAHKHQVPELLCSNCSKFCTVRSYWTALSNTCQISPVQPTGELFQAAADQVVNFPNPILQFVSAEISNGITGWDSLILKGLSLYTQWYEAELPSADIFNKVVGLSIDDSSILKILDDDNVVLFKVVDAVLSTRSIATVPEEFTRVIDTKLRNIVAESSQLFGKHDEQKWTLLILYMEILTQIMENDSNVKLLLSNAGIVGDISLLLNNCKTLLPAYGKLNSAPSELKVEDFPMVKSTAIALLSQVVVHNPEAQNQARELGAMALVLESCVIDSNNPYMKERAIICVRYLLENNDKNQAFVASLEAQQVVNTDDLQKAGLEAEVVGGKLQVKSRGKRN